MQELSRVSGRPVNLCYKEASALWTRVQSADASTSGDAAPAGPAFGSPGKEHPAMDEPKGCIMVTPNCKRRRNITSTPTFPHTCSKCGHCEYSTSSPAFRGPTRTSNKKHRQHDGHKELESEPTRVDSQLAPATGGEARPTTVAAPSTTAPSTAMTNANASDYNSIDGDEDLGMNFDGLAD